jgi:phenylacetate-coenzyme A ligase PaaK-like adenylate-forming protein
VKEGRHNLQFCSLHPGDIVQNAYGYGLFTGGFCRQLSDADATLERLKRQGVNMVGSVEL